MLNYKSLRYNQDNDPKQKLPKEMELLAKEWAQELTCLLTHFTQISYLRDGNEISQVKLCQNMNYPLSSCSQQRSKLGYPSR